MCEEMDGGIFDLSTDVHKCVRVLYTSVVNTYYHTQIYLYLGFYYSFLFFQTFVSQPVNKKSRETGLKWNYIF